MKPLSEHDLVFYACAPGTEEGIQCLQLVGLDEAHAALLRSHLSDPNMEHTKCTKCGIDIVVGPNQRPQMARRPGNVLCFLCTHKMIGKSKSSELYVCNGPKSDDIESFSLED